ncbi:MAG: hypothetical protein HY074_16425 [Deltaproteobacteria bacterium]|nr:hypothetical protein [Deltaproteobacteria bacterium]
MPFENILEAYARGTRQLEDCTCGPASLALATRAIGLEQRPETAWLSPEIKRWLPVDEFRTRGMALHEASLTTELVYRDRIEVRLRRAYPENLSQLVQDVEEASLRNADRAVVVNFCQDMILGHKTRDDGAPHYSPVAGFERVGARILLADVDRAIEKPYWVTAAELFAAMQVPNPALGTPRGWLLLLKR